MHEFSLMQNVLTTVEKTANQSGARCVTEVRLAIGEMAEVVADAMQFAFEALTLGTICEGATLNIETVPTRSRCVQCGHEFTHDRYQWTCPKCASLATELISGREMYISSIEIEEKND
ncbi:MAG: hydrogenase maturation nickel metallochaperone HypA [Coriobacteriales bacterium]|jgi:hydrogenase nickel incorporation protein HypA/HybF|nr:hydrogenase maturation nickel metallochaperone HypA [Coriobacteriales bacterium]